MYHDRFPPRLLPGVVRRAPCCRLAGTLAAGGRQNKRARSWHGLTIPTGVLLQMMLQEGGVKIWRPRQVRWFGCLTVVRWLMCICRSTWARLSEILSRLTRGQPRRDTSRCHRRSAIQGKCDCCHHLACDTLTTRSLVCLSLQGLEEDGFGELQGKGKVVIVCILLEVARIIVFVKQRFQMGLPRLRREEKSDV
jgi:hypothetical protein